MSSMVRDGERDFVGYGAHPPDPRWPGGARLALNFVLNVEEGAEAPGEAHLTELYAANADVPGRDLGAESMFEFGARAGHWRLMRLFVERSLPLTFFACARALECHPPLAAAIGELCASGSDVCGHGYLWEKHYLLDEATERERIAQTVSVITAATGHAPLGWYCRYAPSASTRRLLVEHGGFLYDSDSYADELPWWVDVAGHAQLVVPYTLTNNDVQFVRGNIATGQDFCAFLEAAIDQLIDEGEAQPKMMSVGLHGRVTGHPARARALAGLLDRVGNDPRVWVTNRESIARHWQRRFPPPSSQHCS